MAPKIEGPSNRGRQSHSTLPLGATSAHVSQSDRKPYSAMGGNGLPPSGTSSCSCLTATSVPYRTGSWRRSGGPGVGAPVEQLVEPQPRDVHEPRGHRLARLLGMLEPP